MLANDGTAGIKCKHAHCMLATRIDHPDRRDNDSAPTCYSPIPKHVKNRVSRPLPTMNTGWIAEFTTEVRQNEEICCVTPGDTGDTSQARNDTNPQSLAQTLGSAIR